MVQNEGDTFEVIEVVLLLLKQQLQAPGCGETLSYDDFIQDLHVLMVLSEWASVSFSTPNGSDLLFTSTVTMLAMS